MQQSVDDSPGVILVLGAPGTGKSLLGAKLAQLSPDRVVFLSVGNRLRELGDLDAYRQEPSLQKLEGLRQTARSMVEVEFQRILSPLTRKVEGHSSHSILVLEFVKEIDDAYAIMDLLRTYDRIRLLQILYVSNPCVGQKLWQQAPRSIRPNVSTERDKERAVAERQAKWNVNVGALLEFFSSLGLMSEVSEYGHESILAQLGYSAAPDRQNGTSNLSTGKPQWASSLILPPSLTFTPLQWVVSPRLLTDKKFVDSLLHETEAITELRMFAASPKLPVPSHPVDTVEGAAWVAWPGRYCVSRKCDGTRHLLIVGGDGIARLRNRSGFMYEYPVRVARKSRAPSPNALLPAGTVLDGELVWVGGQGFFLAFDAISVGDSERHKRAWQLQLPDRLALLRDVLALEEAETCVELLQAAEEAKEQKTKDSAIVKELWCEEEKAWEEYVTSSVSAKTREVAAATHSRRRPMRSSKPFLANAAFYRDVAKSYEKDRKPWPALLRQLHKKQQAPAPGLDTLTVVWKQHLSVTAASLEELEATLPACPYPTDGLVFTPRETPYVLGMEELLRKWQPLEQAFGDIQAGVGLSAKFLEARIAPIRLVPGLVYECRLDECRRISGDPRLRHRDDGPGLGPQWRPVSIRWDKLRGNHPSALSAMKLRRSDEALLDAVAHAQAKQTELLLCASLRAVALPGRPAEDGAPAPPSATRFHPARATLPFDGLYRAILAAVAGGSVERTVDTATGLEIFNRRPRDPASPNPGGASREALAAPPPPPTGIESMCRGLVCHPPSARVVATPFGSFADPPGRPWPASRRDEVARAAVKVDGSLAIAFLWEGALRVCTRRRMDSEQALWAQAWLRSRAPADAFEPGWTYLFEAVFADNAMVVPYPFDSPVLLAAVAPDGARAPHAACAALAARMGVMLAPSVEGTLGEFERFLAPPRAMPRAQSGPDSDSESEPEAGGGGTGGRRRAPRPAFASEYESASDSDRQGLLASTPPAAFEGWVVTCGDGTNVKLVDGAYKRSSAAADLLHPLIVWDRVRTGGEGRSGMLDRRCLAAHHRAELAAILDALQASYGRARGLVLAQALPGPGLEAARSDSVPEAPHGSGSGPAPSGSGAEGLGAEALALAADTARRLGGAGPASMHYDTALGRRQPRHWCLLGAPGSASGGGHGLMRTLLLDCVRPGADGSLPGYAPSRGCLATIAKGWAGGPRFGRLAAAAEPLIAAKLSGAESSLLGLVLGELDGRAMAGALLVSREWSVAIRNAPGFADRVEKMVSLGLSNELGLSYRDDMEGLGYSDSEPEDYVYSGYGSR